MMTETKGMIERIYMLVEADGKAKNGFVSDYSIIREKTMEIPKGYFLLSVEVKHTNQLKTFTIIDEHTKQVHDTARLFTDKESLEVVIDLVKQINGYNNEILMELIYEIFKGESLEDAEVVTF